MRPLRGLRVSGDGGGRLQMEERCKASLCFPKKGGLYVDRVRPSVEVI